MWAYINQESPLMILFSPLGILSVIIIIFPIAFFRIYKLKENADPNFEQKRRKCIIISCVIVFISGMFFLSYIQYPSRVDISPLENLQVKSFYDTSEATLMFEKICLLADDNRSEYTMREQAMSNGIQGSCSIRVYRRTEKTIEIPHIIEEKISVSIWMYGKTEDAIKSYNYEKSSKSMNTTRRKSQTISAFIDIVKHYSEMERYAEYFYSYDSERHTETLIRIGNIEITIHERSPVHLVGKMTDEFIIELCRIFEMVNNDDNIFR